MTLREIASTIMSEYPSITCKVKTKDNQIWIQSDLWPDEVCVLLSPYYQARIQSGFFSETDLGEVFIEVERFQLRGF